jgi:hypothetical protein
MCIRTGDTWSLQQKIFAHDAGAGDQFGFALALDNGTLVVASYADDKGAGSVEVWTRQGSEWTWQQKIVAQDPGAGDQFGLRVSLDNDTLVASSPYDNAGASTQQGSVEVWTRQGDAWAFEAKLTATAPAAQDYFGYATAIQGDLLAIGDFGHEQSRGLVEMWVREGATWTVQQALQAPVQVPYASFGYALALDGGTLAVAAPYDVGEVGDQGSVYVWTQVGVVWSLQQRIFANDPAASDSFGFAVALHAGTLAVGSVFDSNAVDYSGSAELWHRDGGVWTFLEKDLASDPMQDDEAGYSLAVDNRSMLMSAPFHDEPEAIDQGSVYQRIYDEDGDGVPTAVDCDDKDPANRASRAFDADCDKVLDPVDDCL